MTPANWRNGDPMIVPMPTTFCELEKREKEIAEKRNGMSWYLSFKQVPQNLNGCNVAQGKLEEKTKCPTCDNREEGNKSSNHKMKN